MMRADGGMCQPEATKPDVQGPSPLTTPAQTGTAEVDTMAHIAFFGHNISDAAVRRRVVAFQRSGHDVTGFMMRRGELTETPWKNHDLGRSYDNAYLHRLSSIRTGAKCALRHTDDLAAADLIYARNLDMLACAQWARRSAGLKTPLVFECLDIHKRLTEPGLSANILRTLERYLVQQSALVVCSSPAFFRAYFDKHYPEMYKGFLLENRLIEGDAFEERGSRTPRVREPGAPLRIGWFGNLRCRRSLELMKRLAETFGNRVEIDLRGYAAPNVFPDFEDEIAPYPSIRFGGRYNAPQDLAELYAAVDVQWGGDFHEAGANSVWLLPNRLYEGGFYGTPLICPHGTETARWITRNGGGFTVAENLEDTLPKLIQRLIDEPAAINAATATLRALPRDRFIESPSDTRALIDAALGNPDQVGIANIPAATEAA